MRWVVLSVAVLLAGCEAPPATVEPKPGMDEYVQLQEGMTLPQVQHALNAQGELKWSSTSAGHELESYRWKGDEGSINVIFMDGALSSKSQYGLR